MKLALLVLIIIAVMASTSYCACTPSKCNNSELGNLNGKLIVGPYSLMSYNASILNYSSVQQVEGTIYMYNSDNTINYVVNTTHPTFSFTNRTTDNEVFGQGLLVLDTSNTIPQLSVNINLTSTVDDQLQNGGVNLSIVFDSNFPNPANNQTFGDVQFQWTFCCNQFTLENATVWTWIDPYSNGEFYPVSAALLTLENPDQFVRASFNGTQHSVNVHFKLTPVSIIQDSTICQGGNCARHTSFLYMTGDD